MPDQLSAEQSERIVCAALRSGDFVVCGVRHFDEIMRSAIVNAGWQNKDWEQGFVTNKKRFIGREEGLALATRNGQLKAERIAKLPQLYSEDIY